MTMNFDNIAETQLFEGNTIDCIFQKKRPPRKRKPQLERNSSIILNAPVYQSTPEDDSPEAGVVVRPEEDVPGQFAFTNDNLIRRELPTGALFQQYFPPEVLRFNAEELADINDLYQRLVEQQTQADRMLLSEANVNELEKSSLIEKFLQEQRHVSSIGTSSQSPSFLLDSNSSPQINMSSE